MKKTMMKMMTAVLMLLAAPNVHAQDWQSVLNGVLGGGQSEDIISGITSIFSSDKQATTNNIIGTWS